MDAKIVANRFAHSNTVLSSLSDVRARWSCRIASVVFIGIQESYKSATFVLFTHRGSTLAVQADKISPLAIAQRIERWERDNLISFLSNPLSIADNRALGYRVGDPVTHPTSSWRRVGKFSLLSVVRSLFGRPRTQAQPSAFASSWNTGRTR